MSGLTEWIKNELYPTVYDSLDTVFPELEFRRYPGGWKSKYKLDLTLPKQKRDDKTVATKKVLGRILEQGAGDTVSYLDYYLHRKGGQIFSIDMLKQFSSLVNLTPPENFNSGFLLGVYEQNEIKNKFLEACNDYFIDCLNNYNIEGEETWMLYYDWAQYHQYQLPNRAEETRGYVDFRGYGIGGGNADMELGYIPSQQEFSTHLRSKGYNQSDIDEYLAINTDSRIGSTHVLTIPYRSGGVIKGFKFRLVDMKEEAERFISDTRDRAIGSEEFYNSLEKRRAAPKYLNSKGLDRNSGFFNIQGVKGDKDVVIVEGELDSLHATVKGVDNVVAAGSSSISSEQIKDAVKKGAKSFSICFDNETGKEETTAKNIDRAIEVILGEGVNRIYIVTLPALGGSKTDPDRLIKEKGVEAFKEAIKNVLHYYEWRLQQILNKYKEIQDNNPFGTLYKRDTDNLLDEVVELASKIPNPIDRDQYKKLFTSLEAIKELGITEESLSITVDRLTSTRDRAVRDKDFTKLLGKAKELHDKGETVTALDLLDSNVKEIKLQDKATEFSSLLIPVKENELIQRLIDKPESLKSGYTIGGEELLLPSGAISVFCAPTSHGKTTLLINTALNIAQSNIGKEVHLFSYEEDRDSILINALNTYLDTQLSRNNRTTLRNNFTGGNSRTIEGKETFFTELIESKKLNIHYTNYNSHTLIEAIRYLHKHGNPGVVLIDYIQLLNLPGEVKRAERINSRQEEMKEICIALKDLAVETGLPIILGAQFNREVTNQLKIHATKIGEAGDIERIANLIVGFWNNTFKPLNPTDGELKDLNSKGANTPDSIYTVVLKNRGGRVGLEEILSFNGNTGKIKNSSNSNHNPL
jgi:DNA primase